MPDENPQSEAASAPAPKPSKSSRAGPRRIGVLTGGGDAPGMNAAIRSIVRSAGAANIEVFGIQRGFEGLIYGNFEPLPSRAVANVIQRGGTILETSRSPQFLTESGRARAAENLRYRGVEAVVMIGGDGTLAGAIAFERESSIPIMFIPASIDNDVPGTDYAIGFDTAVNTALEAIDRIRDTAFAGERLFFIEVMGRDSGFIALAVAIGGGAEAVILPETKCDMDDLCRRIEESQSRGKRSSLIVVSEGPRTGGAFAIAEEVKARVGIPARVVVLGHIQRGGAPTARDRLSASRMGAAAVRALIKHRPSSVIGEHKGELVYVALVDAMGRRPKIDPEWTRLVQTLSV
jgi:6-phosphofructokinase 1